jgi:hypothetical protein
MRLPYNILWTDVGIAAAPKHRDQFCSGVITSAGPPAILDCAGFETIQPIDRLNFHWTITPMTSQHTAVTRYYFNNCCRLAVNRACVYNPVTNIDACLYRAEVANC